MTCGSTRGEKRSGPACKWKMCGQTTWIHPIVGSGSVLVFFVFFFQKRFSFFLSNNRISIIYIPKIHTKIKEIINILKYVFRKRS
jgi:hypothetical protein